MLFLYLYFYIFFILDIYSEANYGAINLNTVSQIILKASKFLFKRGSRGAARAAKSLRWSV